MVSLISEPIFHIGSFPVTNTFLDMLLVDFILVGLSYYLSKNISLIPNLFQSLIEYMVETFYSLTESIAQARASQIFPFFMSFFLFILISNWSGLIPGFGTIGFYEHGELVPLFRSSMSDLNVTLGLALVSAAATHVMSIRTLGVREYLGRYFSLNPVNLYIGILEIISEITKIISLSFRLFGNIFAGEVVLLTVSKMFAFVFPLPFLLLEVIVGVVQALVFSMLTMVFMSILTTSHHEAAEEVSTV